MEENKESRWFDVKYVPKEYIFPKEDRPGNFDTSVCNSFPIVDLSKSNQLEAILKASQEFGFFQVINHGIPEKIVNDAMSVNEEFFNMPLKDIIDSDLHRKGYFYANGSDFTKGKVHEWRDNLKHPCQPLEHWSKLWPVKPANYQEAVAAYIVEIQKLSSQMLQMMCEGLRLEPGYLNDTSVVQLFSSNHYPPCPDPSLTLGLKTHQDPSYITIVSQGNSTGLQVLKDGKWINVGAIPNALVVNIGNQLEIVSNGKLKSVKHRVVTSIKKSRVTISIFVSPTPGSIIEPAKALVNESEPSRYTPVSYNEFVRSRTTYGIDTVAIHNAMLWKAEP